MGGGSKSRTKKKSKSKKKLTSSERQRIYDQVYDQVLSDIQAKQVEEEEKARRLAEEARAREIQARKDKARRDEEIRYRASLNAAADALYDFFTEQPPPHKPPHEKVITRDLFYQRLVEISKKTVGHKDLIQPLDIQARNGKEVNYENDTASPTHSTWIDMKPLDASSSSQPLNEVTKSTQNLSL